jgi:acetyl/propionyl-CoA carboxylase alpha subunit
MQLPMIWTTIKDLGFEVRSNKTSQCNKAPMPGLIEINVVVGQTVKKMILIDPEAMKMENSFLSPRWSNQIDAVSKGDAVDKGQLLIEFEKG